jgi:hypothetical protein
MSFSLSIVCQRNDFVAAGSPVEEVRMTRNVLARSAFSIGTGVLAVYVAVNGESDLFPATIIGVMAAAYCWVMLYALLIARE